MLPYWPDSPPRTPRVTVLAALVIAVVLGLLIINALARHDAPTLDERRELCGSTGGRWVQLSPDDWACLYTYGQ